MMMTNRMMKIRTNSKGKLRYNKWRLTRIDCFSLDLLRSDTPPSGITQPENHSPLFRIVKDSPRLAEAPNEQVAE